MRAAGAPPLRLPGLVDLQVNGWDGVDFNAPGLGAEDVARAARGLLGTGVVAFLPTVVTGPRETMKASLAAIAAAAAAAAAAGAATARPSAGPGSGGARIAGIHLEGPFISPLDGPRGAHPRAHVLEPDLDLARELLAASGGLLRMVTLAPEAPGALALVRWCAERGIIAAIGHSAASGAEIRAAVEAGARLSTHLGNGCAGTLPRHPNLLWEQLAEDGLAATAIADGHHLPDAVLRVFARAKGAGFMLVSDVTALGGAAPGIHEAPIGGRVLLEASGRLSVEGSPGTLAGAALPLLAGVRHCVERGIAGLAEAWDWASTRPAALLGLPEPPGELLLDAESWEILEVRSGPGGKDGSWKAA